MRGQFGGTRVQVGGYQDSTKGMREALAGTTDYLQNIDKMKMLKEQQARDNAIADARLGIAQAAEGRAAAKDELATAQRKALLGAAQDTPKSGYDIALNERIAEAYEHNPSKFNLAYGFNADGTGQGDSGQQTDFSKYLQQSITEAPGMVTNVDDYMQRMTAEAVRRGADPTAAAKQATALGSLVTPTGAAKAQKGLLKEEYAVKKDIMDDRLATLDKALKSHSTKGKSYGKGSYGSKPEDFSKMTVDLLSEFKNTDWWSDDLGGEDLREELKKLRLAGYHNDDIYLAAMLNASGENDVFWGKDREIEGSGFEETLKELAAERIASGDKAEKKESVKDRFTAARTKLIGKKAALGDAYIKGLGGNNIANMTDAERADATMRTAFEIANKDNLVSDVDISGVPDIPEEPTAPDTTIKGRNKGLTKPTEQVTSGSYLDNLTLVESGVDGYKAENARTGAYGRYQILPSTAKDYFGKDGITENNWKTAENQDKIFTMITDTNRAELRKAGVEDTQLNLYGAHQQGLTGYKEILDSANNGTKLSSVRISKIRGNLPNNGKGVADDEIANEWFKYWGTKFPGKQDIGKAPVDPAIAQAFKGYKPVTTPAKPAEKGWFDNLKDSVSRGDNLAEMLGFRRGEYVPNPLPQETGVPSVEAQALGDEILPSLGLGALVKTTGKKVTSALGDIAADKVRKSKLIKEMKEGSMRSLNVIKSKHTRLKKILDKKPGVNSPEYKKIKAEATAEGFASVPKYMEYLRKYTGR